MKPKMKLLLTTLLSILVFSSCKNSKQVLTADTQGFALGADISWITELESRGTTFATAEGEVMECTKLMKQLGMDAIRLRVWVNPRNEYSSAADVLKKAQRAKANGMDIMIDFHYSDTWADPGKQFIPKAWESHTYEEMLNDVSEHTTMVLQLLKKNGIEPRWVQVGNETSNGLLWPMGKIGEQPEHYAGFISVGCKAVKQVFPRALTIVHLDNGFDRDLYEYNLGVLLKNKVDYDVVGMSLYPLAAVEWHPTKVSSAEDAVNKCIANIKYMYEWLGKPTIITEVGVKVTDPEGGKRILSSVIQGAKKDTEGHCLGVFYWEPEAAVGYNGGYDMGAFVSDGKVNKPTIIMDAFKK